MREIINEQSLEELVLQGLEYENIEKDKAAERKALTRKHGLKPEEAKYVHSTTGQTRDIVADKLGISGRQWERMRFIYRHRDCLLDEEYEKWKTGKISTSKIYKELSNDLRYNDILDQILNILDEMQRESINYEKSYVVTNINNDLQSALYGCKDRTKQKVESCFDRLKQYNTNFLNKHYNEISIIKSDLMDLRQKLKMKTHSNI